MPRQPLNYNPAAELTQVLAAPTIQGERTRMDPRESNAFRLAEALGIAMPVVEKFGQDYERKRLEEQTSKLDHYKEVFAQDRAEGAVTLAQVKERLPETVPTIAAKIAESMGKQDAERQMAALIEEINGNDEIRLDSGKRAAFIQQKRVEIFGKIPKGRDHEFYSSGFAAGMDAQFNQWGNSWQREAAAFHEKVQGEEFGKEIVIALNSGQALEPIDGRWKGSSSLNHLERNKIVVDTVIETAFTNDDPELLKTVPTRFLNAAAKDALRRAGDQITQVRLATVRQGEYLKTQAKAKELDGLKTEIIQDLAGGKPVDPRKYRSNPDAFEYALRMQNMPVVDEATSAASMAHLEQSILDTATVSSGETLQQLTDRVRLEPNITPQHKQALITKLPKLMEGRTLMEDPTVRQPINDRLNPRLQELAASTNSIITTMMKGGNLRSQVMRQYDQDIRRFFQAEFEETGRWPMGHRKIELIDKAVDRAEATLEKMTRINSTNSDQSQVAPAASPAAPPTFNPKTQKRVEVMPGIYQYVPK